MTEDIFAQAGKLCQTMGLRLLREVIDAELSKLNGFHAGAIKVKSAASVAATTEKLKRRYEKKALPAPEPPKRSAQGVKDYWAAMTPEERTAEMRRRVSIHAAKVAIADGVTSPLPKPIVKRAPPGLRPAVLKPPPLKKDKGIHSPDMIGGRYTAIGVSKLISLAKASTLTLLKQANVAHEKVRVPDTVRTVNNVYAEKDLREFLKSRNINPGVMG